MAVDMGMGIMGSTKRRSPISEIAIFLRSSFVVVCVLPMASFAGDFGGGVRIGISQIDNVFLVTSPNEIDDIVYQASPFLSFLHESPTLDANLDYTFDWYRYADLDATSKWHSGVASLIGKAWEESLAVGVGAGRSQVLGDPSGVIPPGSLPLSGNLVNQDEWWLNARFNRKVSRAVTINANYTYSKFQFKDDLIQDNTNQIADFGLDNYAAGQGLTWALRYEWRQTEYEISLLPWENQRATAELGVWVNAKTRIFGSGGKESAWDDPFDPTMTDPFWEAGFAFSAGENLSAEFAAGERSFGSSWRGNLDYTFRRGSTSAGYSQTPTTTGFHRSGSPNGLSDETGTAPDPDGLDDFLSRPGTAERYISKRFQWNLNLEFRRTGFSLAVFDEDRSDRTSANGIPLPDQSATGITANFSWQAGVRTEFVAFGSIVDREYDDTNRTRYSGGGLTANYSLGERSELSLSYSYREQRPIDEIAISQDYVVNIVSLYFTFTM
jgi:uncharacterized protein (PEP-CTERM system associated)